MTDEKKKIDPKPEEKKEDPRKNIPIAKRLDESRSELHLMHDCLRKQRNDANSKNEYSKRISLHKVMERVRMAKEELETAIYEYGQMK